jgi:hypothetical protein
MIAMISSAQLYVSKYSIADWAFFSPRDLTVALPLLRLICLDLRLGIASILNE